MSDVPEGLEDLPDSNDLDDFTEDQLEALLEHETKELPKDLRIVQAKWKSRKARAKMEEKEEDEEDEDAEPEPSEQERAAERARTFPDVRRILKAKPELVEGLAMQTHVPTVLVDPPRADELLRYCHRVLDYDHLACLTAADHADRMDVVWNLYAYDGHRKLAVKAQVPRDDPEVPSATGIWRAADWFEREVWDLFGIRFPGHPNLKRIMMPEAWDGHPLRKDYAITEEQYIGMDELGNDTVARSPEGGW